MDLKDYKGYKKVTLSDEALSRLYQEGTLPQYTNFELLENETIIHQKIISLFIQEYINMQDIRISQLHNMI